MRDAATITGKARAAAHEIREQLRIVQEGGDAI
jgi:hypothetical protein